MDRISRSQIDSQRGFVVQQRLEARSNTAVNAAGRPLGRAGVLTTAHGVIRTPAFIPVGTLATVKGVLPEQMAQLGAQALLANAYHLYLQPGDELVAQAGVWGRS